MPNIANATEWQRATLAAIAARIGAQPSYTGPQDDCYKFIKGSIFGYIKLFAANTRSTPPSGLKVIVEEKFWSQIRDDLQEGNDWYGKPSRHRLFAAGDPTAVEAAAAILSEACSHLPKK
jgi:hypothetical protein